MLVVIITDKSPIEMASTAHNPSILLKRTFLLKEQSTLLLCIDSLAQSHAILLSEFVYYLKAITTIIYVSFETVNKPSYATHFIDASSISLQALQSTLQSYLPQPQETNALKHLVIIDAINYVSVDKLASFISSIASSPLVSLFVVYHKSVPESKQLELQNYPSSIQLLKFIATTILELSPMIQDQDIEEIENSLDNFIIPCGLNSHIYKLTLTNRRKSGRSVSYEFQIDGNTHRYELIDKNKEDHMEESSKPLEGLTTFNLMTSQKQKIAKDQVELPFFEARNFNVGGAIVYEYEKDDDYDEEDPYEDPF